MNTVVTQEGMFFALAAGEKFVALGTEDDMNKKKELIDQHSDPEFAVWFYGSSLMYLVNPCDVPVVEKQALGIWNAVGGWLDRESKLRMLERVVVIAEQAKWAGMEAS